MVAIWMVLVPKARSVLHVIECSAGVMNMPPRNWNLIKESEGTKQEMPKISFVGSILDG